MRLIVVTPLEYEGGGVVADPAAYQDMLSGLGERLESRGLTLGEEFSPLDAPRRNPLLLAGAALLPAALAVLLLCLIIPASPDLEHILLVLGILIAAGGAFLLPDLLQTLVAFGAGCTWGRCWPPGPTCWSFRSSPGSSWPSSSPWWPRC